MLNNIFEKLKCTGNRANKSDSFQVAKSPVILNVYDMFWMNEYINNIGIGVYHSGVEVYSVEYCYGGHPFKMSGIFPMEPKSSDELGENYSFKSSIEIGRTDFTSDDVNSILENLSKEFTGEQYHLLNKNCNHFSEAFCQILCGKPLPKWVNRLANVSTRIPFIERAIPKEWITPLAYLDEQDAEIIAAITESSIHTNGFDDALGSGVGSNSQNYSTPVHNPRARDVILQHWTNHMADKARYRAQQPATIATTSSSSEISSNSVDHGFNNSSSKDKKPRGSLSPQVSTEISSNFPRSEKVLHDK